MFRIIDRFLSPRGDFQSLADARQALPGWPGAFGIEWLSPEGIWVRVQW